MKCHGNRVVIIENSQSTFLLSSHKFETPKDCLVEGLMCERVKSAEAEIPSIGMMRKFKGWGTSSCAVFIAWPTFKITRSFAESPRVTSKCFALMSN
ncbi:hypothetical protein TNCV_1344731 [Trichonephila clavipes]|nr:hypothetical protein TNCV_1344731 [Trichonephila clavipes]